MEKTEDLHTVLFPGEHGFRYGKKNNFYWPPCDSCQAATATFKYGDKYYCKNETQIIDTMPTNLRSVVIAKIAGKISTIR